MKTKRIKIQRENMKRLRKLDTKKFGHGLTYLVEIDGDKYKARHYHYDGREGIEVYDNDTHKLSAKACCHCREIKSMDEFGISRRNPKKQPYCIECARIVNRENRRKKASKPQQKQPAKTEQLTLDVTGSVELIVKPTPKETPTITAIKPEGRIKRFFKWLFRK